MPNIRIDLSSPVYDGQTLTFKSPADCSKVTGILVYYPENGTVLSKVFDFADAHGNNVGETELFAENVLVKVILDTELNRAYVQNADTNAYIENTFAKNLVIVPFKKTVISTTGYIDRNSSVKKKEGCTTYCVDFPRADAGRTVKVRTYAFGEMACVFTSGSNLVEEGVTNVNADIESDPKSGIWDLELVVPDCEKCKLWVSFYENDYVECKIYDTRTLWDEIDLLKKDYIVASGVSQGWHYHKWSSGFAECWQNVFVQGPIYINDPTGCIFRSPEMDPIPLPFSFQTVEASDISVDSGGYTILAAWTRTGNYSAYTPSYRIMYIGNGCTLNGVDVRVYIAGTYK